MNLNEEERQLIEEHRRQKKQGASYPIREVSEIPDAEKISHFNRLFAFAKSVWDEHATNGCYDNDLKSYAFEALMDCLVDPDKGKAEFWKAFRSLGQGAV